jgi:hypothetical protein
MKVAASIMRKLIASAAFVLAWPFTAGVAHAAPLPPGCNAPVPANAAFCQQIQQRQQQYNLPPAPADDNNKYEDPCALGGAQGCPATDPCANISAWTNPLDKINCKMLPPPPPPPGPAPLTPQN